MHTSMTPQEPRWAESIDPSYPRIVPETNCVPRLVLISAVVGSRALCLLNTGENSLYLDRAPLPATWRINLSNVQLRSNRA